MKLKTVYVRFYKSFNYDYLRKHHPEAKAFPWETIDGAWYPYVRVPIDTHITTIVGANESGKTHLLSAIEKGITGRDICREDFCRYSHYFTVEAGRSRPDFGLEWTALTPDDWTKLCAVFEIPAQPAPQSVFVFRAGDGTVTLYLPPSATNPDFPAFSLEPSPEHESAEGTTPAPPAPQIDTLGSCFPRVFRIDPQIALPPQVPLAYLKDPDGAPLSQIAYRRDRAKLVDWAIRTRIPDDWARETEIPKAATAIAGTFNQLRAIATTSNKSDEGNDAASLKLAADLLFKVARIDRSAVIELSNALLAGNKDGYANGIVQKINDNLSKYLNFPNWWVQDKAFALTVSPRDHDLVFTIRDRTGTQYSFHERSHGLRFFLSYYIQYLAHTSSGDSEILLMDEPDAFLSAEAQQDLLKVFSAFAFPTTGRAPVQVVYVTHSPFLIDRNHAARLRVLHKGNEDEGTRVVRDASRNHYEPLRSSLGVYVAETTFIGHCNVLVEGTSDQVLLAAAISHIRRQDLHAVNSLDLNHVTIVPCGSASHVPYLVYLATGRDLDKPALIVLLDSDPEGDKAKQELLKEGGARKRPLMPAQFLMQVRDLVTKAGIDSELGFQPVDLAGILPLDLTVHAARRYLLSYASIPTEELTTPPHDELIARLKSDGRVIEILERWYSDALKTELHIDKIGFARSVSELLSNSSANSPDVSINLLTTYTDRMRRIIAVLAKLQRQAEQDLRNARVGATVNRLMRAFIADHETVARRDQAIALCDDIENVLSDDLESDRIRIELSRVRSDFVLREDIQEVVPNYVQFKMRLDRLRYAGVLESPAKLVT